MLRDATHLAAGAVLLLPALCACAGCSLTPPGADLMDKTTAGQHRCVVSGDEIKLFAIDWDATDTASFQSRAERDVVFVHYADCQLRVIEGCSDASLAGRYGTYREPVFTSGALEGFSIKTKDELAAKLPLGVVSLGAEVSSDRALQLRYFVAGMVMATRDDVYRAELADNPRCQDATHVVWGYTLGAFELSSADATKLGGGVDYQGIGVEGGHTESAGVLRKAGDMSACRKVDRHPCQVPIRLTLRPIRPGAPPRGVPAPVAPQAGGEPNLAAAQSQMGAVQYRLAAEQKYLAHDGAGCLRDLELADSADPQGRLGRLELRAKCEMRAGKCEEGKAHYRELRKAWYRKHNPTGLASDATVEAEVAKMARQECATAAGGGKSPQNSALELTQEIMHASMLGDAQACITHGRALAKQARAHDTVAKEIAGAGLQHAAKCAAAKNRCAEAKELYLGFAELFMNMTGSMAESAFQQNVPECAGK